MHDAHEAYIGDISTPVKDAIRALGGEGLDTLDQMWMTAIATKFGFPASHDPSVKAADRTALAYEVGSFMNRSERPWYFEGAVQAGVYYSAWPVDAARDMFLRMFHELKPNVRG